MIDMNKKIKLIAGVVLFSGFLASCATPTDPADAFKNESAHEIYVKGKGDLRSKDYSEAIKRFEALDVQYPYGEETENSQLYIIYAYYMKEDYILASAAADRFIRIHPTNPHVDYAYYMRGISNYYQNMGLMERLFIVDLATRDLSQIQKSYNDFNELITRFPNSMYAPSAHQYMVFLRNVLADHQLHVAEYYYNRQAYVAAANRASNLVAHYQGAPSVVPGLELMAKAYRKLGMIKLEEDTVAVLKYNYPYARIDYDARYDL
jgi:outer membrane protein assembly factor BamD